MQNINLLALQYDVAWENPAANRDKVDALLRQEPDPADIILLPEMFSTGFNMEPGHLAEPMKGPTHLWMLETARERLALVMGSMIIEEEGKFYNRMLCVYPDGRTITYDKRHPFSFADEDKNYTPGTEYVTFEWRGWRISPQICYDLRFPVWARQRPEQRYDLLIYVANWPAARVAHWSLLLAARAVENQCYVAGVNRIGTDGAGLVYNGNTAIHHPLGNVLDSEVDNERIIRVVLDKKSMDDYRAKFPAWADADVFEIK